MTEAEHHKRVEESTRLREEFRAKNATCPVCGLEGHLQPCGGVGSFWIECPCGAYSALSSTLEEALTNLDGWHQVDPDLNARMYPPVGGG